MGDLMSHFKMDATSPTPKSATFVHLGGTKYDRDGIETAWLLLQEHDDNPLKAASGLREAGYSIGDTVKLVAAANQWTGRIVQGGVR